MIESSNFKELQDNLNRKAYNIFETKLDNLGYSIEELSILNKEDLKERLSTINDLLSNKDKMEQLGSITYSRGVDFELNGKEQPDLVGLGYTINKNLIDRKKLILDLIKTKSQNEKFDSLEDLIAGVEDQSLKEKIKSEIKEFQKQTKELDNQAKALSEEEQNLQSSKQQLEISKSKLEILEKKSQIWLTILAKESIASIIGAILLVIIAVCLIVTMFLGIENTKIIESAFLLILGYFFGHAIAKKN